MEVFVCCGLHALETIETKSNISGTMASLQKEFAKLLTLVLFVIIFALQVAADLAPNEEEEENVKSESKKTDETVTTLEPPKPGSNLGFIHAFIASFSVIIVSEIGDKTFFIAAIMSMVNNRKNFLRCQ